MRKSLNEWLRWQERLNPKEIDLGLDRVRDVAARLPIQPPAGAVFTVAGTNGKGSTVACLDRLLAGAGYRTGVYTSPHLVRYNERVQVAGEYVSDDELIAAFERIEAARGDVALTYFEFGTLAALLVFSDARCDAWVLEVGLGGRLDAVNVVEPDFSLITTIALDHQDWLGDSVEQIAAEKAGILRADAPAFFGDAEVPAAIRARAGELGTRLHCCGEDFAIVRGGDSWSWSGAHVRLDGLALPDIADDAALRNIGLALSAVEQFDSAIVTGANVAGLLGARRPAGRFQVVAGRPQWLLDVAHNPQAARVLRERIDLLDEPRNTTALVGMLADKHVEAFAEQLEGVVDRWIVASFSGPRAEDGETTAQRIACVSDRPVEYAGAPEAAIERALRVTPGDGRILCCGSFHIVGPALEALGLYS